MTMANIEQFHRTLRDIFAQCPAKYQYVVVIITALLIAAHWEHPTGFLPNLRELIGALVAIICVGLLIYVAITVEEYFETATWPWQRDGPMKKWRSWFWGVLDDESAKVGDIGDMGTRSASPQGNEIELAEKTHTSFMNLGQDMHPAADQLLPSPPAPLLLQGLRRATDDPPTPTHKSGLLGESPMPRRFKHFNGDGFHKRNQALNAAARYSGSNTSYLAVQNALHMLKEEADEGHEKDMNMEVYGAFD